MKKIFSSLFFSLVASTCLLAQSNLPTMDVPPAHLEATYDCSNGDVTVTWSADLQNDQAPYLYQETVTIQNNLSTQVSGWTLGIPGVSTKLTMNNPAGESNPSFVILNYQCYDFDTQQFITAPFQSQLVATPHYDFTSGDSNQGTIITMSIFSGNAFRPSTLSNTANIQPSASLSFSYTTELPISSKLVMAPPASMSFAYSTPHLDMLAPNQASN